MKREFDWFDKPDNLKKLRIFSYIILAISVLAEFLIPNHVVHHALFGFATCAVMIVISKLLGQYWLKKSEDYYDK